MSGCLSGGASFCRVLEALETWLRALHRSKDHSNETESNQVRDSALVMSSRTATLVGDSSESICIDGGGILSSLSQASFGGVSLRRTVSGGGSSTISAAAGAVFAADGWEVARLESRVQAVCYCNAGMSSHRLILATAVK